MTLIFAHHSFCHFSENSHGTLREHLNKGAHLAADLNFTRDGIIFWPDTDLKKITKGRDCRPIKQMTTLDACHASQSNGQLFAFEEAMFCLRKHPKQMIALRFKGIFQDSVHCDRLIAQLRLNEDIFDQLLVFDVCVKAAYYLKQKMPALHLAASIAHPFDIERFQMIAKGTLISLETFLQKKHLFSWAWLDEWDLADKNPDGSINRRGKQLYTEEVFDQLRSNSIRIAVVAPELHCKQSGSSKGEAHPHASTSERLFKRIQEMLALKPDAICTGHPAKVQEILLQQTSS
jgi:hypothetical protein